MERSNTRRGASPIRRVIRLHLGVATGVLTLRRRDGEWRPLHQSLSGATISALAVAPEQSETVYAASQDAVYQTTDGGAHWRRAGVALPGARVRSLLALPKPRASLLAGLEPVGIARGEDAGRTWRPVALPPLPPGEVSQIVYVPGEQPLVYAVASGVIVVSHDGGLTWQATGTLRSPVTAMAVHPDAPATMYAGTPAGLFRTRNAGRTWQRLHPDPVAALLIHPSRPRTLIAALPRGLTHSANAGASPQPMPGGEARADDPARLLIGHAAGEIVLAATTSGGLLQLRDTAWSEPRLGPTPPVLALAVATTELARMTTAPKRTQARKRRPPAPREGAPPPRRPSAAPAPS